MRWPGVIRPGTIKNDIFASLDWLPTLVDIAGGDKGDALNKRIMAGSYPGIVKTKLDGVDQIEYLSGRSEKSARDTFFYYSGSDPSAVRYKNWKIYFAMVSDNRAWLHVPACRPYHWAQVVNIKRDPFETSDRRCKQDAAVVGGALAVALHRLHLRLEHAADRPDAVAEGAGILQGVPADAGSGELQPRSGHGADQEHRKARVGLNRLTPEHGGRRRRP